MLSFAIFALWPYNASNTKEKRTQHFFLSMGFYCQKGVVVMAQCECVGGIYIKANHFVLNYIQEERENPKPALAEGRENVTFSVFVSEKE